MKIEINIPEKIAVLLDGIARSRGQSIETLMAEYLPGIVAAELDAESQRDWFDDAVFAECAAAAG